VLLVPAHPFLHARPPNSVLSVWKIASDCDGSPTETCPIRNVCERERTKCGGGWPIPAVTAQSPRRGRSLVPKVKRRFLLQLVPFLQTLRTAARSRAELLLEIRTLQHQLRCCSAPDRDGCGSPRPTGGSKSCSRTSGPDGERRSSSSSRRPSWPDLYSPEFDQMAFLVAQPWYKDLIPWWPRLGRVFLRHELSSDCVDPLLIG